MIQPYYGEFLTSPVPLEMDLNACSHGCRFCFSLLNKPDRTAEPTRIMNLLRDFRSRETLEARLLQEGYPVLVSNKVDPFAHSNYQQAVPILRTMTELGIPVCLQTRGGRGVDEVLEFLPPSVWYISINTATDDLRKNLEPGAPTIESRFRLMETLRDKGHRVVLGLNPLVPEWIPDPLPILERARSCGAEGVWMEALHFNYKQVRQMTVKDRTIMTEPIIARAQKRKCPPACARALDDARLMALDCGLDVFSMGQPFSSNFFQPWKETYQKTFPVAQDVVNWAVKEKPETFSFTDFLARCSDFPQGTFTLDHYIGATAHQVMKTHKIPSRMTYAQLCSILWQDPRIKASPARIQCFAYAAERDGEEWVEWVDDHNMRLLTFVPELTQEYYYAVPSQ